MLQCAKYHTVPVPVKNPIHPSETEVGCSNTAGRWISLAALVCTRHTGVLGSGVCGPCLALFGCFLRYPVRFRCVDPSCHRHPCVLIAGFRLIPPDPPGSRGDARTIRTRPLPPLSASVSELTDCCLSNTIIRIQFRYIPVTLSTSVRELGYSSITGTANHIPWGRKLKTRK